MGQNVLYTLHINPPRMDGGVEPTPTISHDSFKNINKCYISYPYLKSAWKMCQNEFGPVVLEATCSIFITRNLSSETWS